MIKKLIFTFFAVTFFVHISYSQNNSDRTSHYVLSQFTEGVILMEDGSKESKTLNYNAISENFAFNEGGEILAMSKTYASTIDTIYVANRKFFRKDNVFLELLMKSGVELYLEHKCKLESSTAASSGYGSTSQTTSGKAISLVENRGSTYQLELPEIYKAKPYKQYWIIKDKVTTKFKILSQLKKLYKDKKKEIKSYRKTHKVDIKEPLSVLKLVKHLE